MSDHSTTCEIDGCAIPLIWGGEDFGWTGSCQTCSSILQFVPNEEVCHAR